MGSMAFHQLGKFHILSTEIGLYSKDHAQLAVLALPGLRMSDLSGGYIY